MQLTIMSVVTVVRTHARIFRAVFANSSQFLHFQNYLKGLIMPEENKSLANICALRART